MAASLLFAQCKKSEDSAPSEAKPVEMTVTVGPGSKTDIASTGGITWSADDKLYVGDGSKYIGYLTLADGEGTRTGTFTGSVELTDADEGKELAFHFYYLGSVDHTSLTKGAESVEVDFSSQNIIEGTDGKLTNASKQHVCYGRANGTVIGGAVTDINVMLVSKVAIAHFNFKRGNADYAGALTLSGDNIYSTMTVNFNSEVFACTGTKGEISLTNTTSSEKYVMLVPTAETTGSQTLTFAGENLSGEAILENGIKPNKFYGMKDAIAVTLEAAGPTHEYVDLGLPSGLLWATCNVGADSPEDYGWYFMWGSTTNGGDSNCSWANSPGNGGNSSHHNETAFNTWKSSNLTDNVLKPEVDAASVNWGGDWRMPTSAEFEELYDNTDCTWTTENGVNGRKFASRTDATKYIFLPAAGIRNDSDVVNAGFKGDYWSSLLLSSNPSEAYLMDFDSGNVNLQLNYLRRLGCAVRPVRDAR